MTKSAYIHIPFCRQKCNYCSFVSFANKEMIEKLTIDYNKARQAMITQELTEIVGGSMSLNK